MTNSIAGGADLVRLASTARDELVVVAPYIKTGALERILSQASEHLSSVICVTRWLPQDIVSGACDLEIYELLAARPRHSLYAHSHLHAKYYRADDICWIGSANLTNRGLGWAQPSNLEILKPMPAREFQAWEAELLDLSTPVTEKMRDDLGAAAEKLKKAQPPPPLPEVLEPADRDQGPNLWVPSCPAPNRLWDVYSGKAGSRIMPSAKEGAVRDLEVLAPPLGMEETAFAKYVAGVLIHTQIFREVDSWLADEGRLTDDRAHELLQGLLEEQAPLDPETTWTLLKRWFGQFFPDSYLFEREQDVMTRGARLHPR